MYFRLRLKDTKGIVPTKCLRTEFSSELLEFSTDFVNVNDFRYWMMLDDVGVLNDTGKYRMILNEIA